MVHDPSNGRRFLVLGGWRDILQDVARLTAQLEQLPTEGCSCSDHGTGAPCPCCDSARRTLDRFCGPCENVVRNVDSRLAAVLDDVLRYLPAVVPPGSGVERLPVAAHAAALRAELGGLLGLLGQIRSGTGTFSIGCEGAHIGALRSAGNRLDTTAHALDALLHQ